MSKTTDLVRQAPAIAITAAILAFAYGSGVEAQGNGCNSNTCLLHDVMGSCQFRTEGGGHDYCSCMTPGNYQDTCLCSTICGS